MSLKPSQLKNLIKARHESNIFRPLFIESAAGLGKTQIASQVAKELKIGFKAIHAPLLQPEDYGFPVINAKRNDVDFIVSSNKFPIEGSDCEEVGIFLIDELPQADMNAQKILANLIQEREIHGKKLKKNWTIVCTGNRQSDRAGANRILGHLANRLTRVELEASLDDWTQWALENDVSPEVIAFIRFRPDLLCNYSSKQDVNATPRSWVEGVSAGLGVVEQGLEFSVFTGDVGEGPASEFLAFLKLYRNLPDIDSILRDPKKSTVPTDPATLYAVVGAIAYKSTPNNFDRALTYIRRLPKEFSVLFIRDATMRDRSLMATKTYIDWASKEGAELLA